MKSERKIIDFFANSEILDYLVLRPLSHISLNWELTWNPGKQEYQEEQGNFSRLLNNLIIEISKSNPTHNYHLNEDTLAEYVIVQLKWPIKKIGKRWVGMDYRSILSQGGFKDEYEKNLMEAAAGRVRTAIFFQQNHFDEMEASHQTILASVLSIILYHRFNEIQNL